MGALALKITEDKKKVQNHGEGKYVSRVAALETFSPILPFKTIVCVSPRDQCVSMCVSVRTALVESCIYAISPDHTA